MIWWGTKVRKVTGGPVQDAACSNCSNPYYTAYGEIKYLYIYWIPMFIMSKNIGIECTNCGQTLVDDQIPGRIIQQTRSDVFTPARILPMYTGIFLIALIGLWIIDLHRADLAEEAGYLADPQINDYYVVRLDEIFGKSDPELPFGILRISKVNETNVEMQLGKQKFKKSTDFRQDINQARVLLRGYFEPEVFVFSMDELLAYQESGAIFTIERRSVRM